MAMPKKLSCKTREIKNKGYLNQMKREEWVPAIIYSQGNEAYPIFVGNRQMQKMFNEYGSKGLLILDIEEGTPTTVIVRDIQKNPLTGKLIHVDFLKVDMSHKISNSVSIHFIGEEVIQKKGGIIQTGVREVEIECLPQDIPEHITIDISALNIGDSITIGDLSLPEGVELLSDANSGIVSIVAPGKAIEELEGEEDAEATVETEKE